VDEDGNPRRASVVEFSKKVNFGRFVNVHCSHSSTFTHYTLFHVQRNLRLSRTTHSFDFHKLYTLSFFLPLYFHPWLLSALSSLTFVSDPPQVVTDDNEASRETPASYLMKFLYASYGLQSLVDVTCFQLLKSCLFFYKVGAPPFCKLTRFRCLKLCLSIHSHTSGFVFSPTSSACAPTSTGPPRGF
jgi:hypothetical protein